MSALRVVCFDFDGTLGYMDPPHVRLYIRAAAEHGTEIAEQALLAALGEDRGGGLGGWEPWRTPAGVDHSAHSGSEQAFRALRTRLHRERLDAVGAEGDLDAITARLCQLEEAPEAYRLFADALPALDRVAAAGLRSIVVSNHLWRLPEIVDALGIGERTAGVVTSARVGYRKPHPEIYRAALELAAVDARDVLFVGDNMAADVDGPRRAGMRAVFLDRSASPAEQARGSDGSAGSDRSDGTDDPDGSIATLDDLPI